MLIMNGWPMTAQTESNCLAQKIIRFLLSPDDIATVTILNLIVVTAEQEGCKI